MNTDKKKLKKEYQRTHTPIGVFQISNMVNDKVLIGTSLNLPGILNRHKFQLEKGGHSNRVLQAEWNEYGSASFAFEILDEITPSSDPQYDYKDDLAFLEEFWLAKMEPYGEKGYNERPIGSEQRLRNIAAARLKRDHERDDESN